MLGLDAEVRAEPGRKPAEGSCCLDSFAETARGMVLVDRGDGGKAGMSQGSSLSPAKKF